MFKLFLIHPSLSNNVIILLCYNSIFIIQEDVLSYFTQEGKWAETYCKQYDNEKHLR